MNDEIKYNETANINFKEIATVSEEFIKIKVEDEGMIGGEDEIYRDFQGKKFRVRMGYRYIFRSTASNIWSRESSKELDKGIGRR